MTEAGWLASSDVLAMVSFLIPRLPGDRVGGQFSSSTFKTSDRKLRLFCCACCRQIWHLFTDVRSRNAVIEMEAKVDGVKASHASMAIAGEPSQAWQAMSSSHGLGGLTSQQRAQWNAADAVAMLADSLSSGMVDRPVDFFNLLVCAETFATGNSVGPSVISTRWAPLLREVVGNPWRPVSRIRLEEDVPPLIRQLHPQHWPQARWLTPTVLSIARRCYDELDFDALPILADALEEGGCDSDELLRHLRGEGRIPRRCYYCDGTGHDQEKLNDPNISYIIPPQCGNCYGDGFLKDQWDWVELRGPHVRGCWALDCILGLS